MGHTIGIDLGTTNSCVAILERGETTVIPNPEGARTTPSVVAYTEAGEERVGVVAKRQAVTNPTRTLYAFKRLMGQRFDSEVSRKHAGAVSYGVVEAENGDAWVAYDDKRLSPPQVSATVLRAIKGYAETYLGEEVTDAVVTVPAYFDDAQRQATKDAGKIAGLNVLRILNEPTAAALAYTGVEGAERKFVAVYDLGGGTFDVSILELSDGVYAVKSTAGDTHLGGEDFDALIINLLAEGFKEEHGIDLRDNPQSLQRLKEQAEKAKHELSTSLQTEINLPFITADASGPKHLIRELKRSDFEVLAGELIARTLEPCKQALSDAKLSKSDIDEVLLVGGQTRMPLVQKRVTEFFGKEPSKTLNPDEVVAEGAAKQAASLSGESDDTLLLLDVTPLSLGVETGGGVFTPLIERNTTVPTRASEIFTTSVDNQNFVPVHVLQGERPMAADNRSLARFELAPIPPAPRGVPQIEVSFDIDADGIVSVSAKDLGTGREQSVQVVASSGLSESQITELVEEAEAQASSDADRRELADLRNAAEALLYSTSRAVEACRDWLDAELVAELEEGVAALELIKEADSPALSDFKAALTELEQIAFRMAEAMYPPTE